MAYQRHGPRRRSRGDESSTKPPKPIVSDLKNQWEFYLMTNNNYRPPVGRNSRQFGQGQKRGKGRPRGATGMKTIVQNLARQMHHVPQFEKPITTVDLLLLQLRILR